MNTPTTAETNQSLSPDDLRRRREERNRLENEIAELSARIDAAIYELLVRIRRFDELEGWSGATSYPQWLSWRGNGQAALEEAGGIRVSAETSRRLACDAGKVVMRHDAEGNVLDVGRKTRTISPALRRALASRDRHCQFPGCEATRCEAHHITHWANGGATKLENLVLLCRRHHRLVHEEGFGLTLDADGRPQFTHATGRPLPTAPAMSAWTGAPLAPTDAKLAGDGIEIDSNTSISNWSGERLDLPYVIGVAWRPGDNPGAEETA